MFLPELIFKYTLISPIISLGLYVSEGSLAIPKMIIFRKMGGVHSNEAILLKQSRLTASLAYFLKLKACVDWILK